MTNPEASEAAEIDGLEARFFDALSFFWRGVRTEAWFAAWPEIVSGVSALEGESESENDDGDADDAIAALAPLAVERAFAKCFYGVGDETIPLAQSCWESAEHTYGGPAALACTTLYRRFGLKTDGADRLPDDHIGVMLAFAAELVRRGEIETLERFLRVGALAWWPRVVEAIEGAEGGETILPVARTTLRLLRIAQARAAAI